MIQRLHYGIQDSWMFDTQCGHLFHLHASAARHAAVDQQDLNGHCNGHRNGLLLLVELDQLSVRAYRIVQAGRIAVHQAFRAVSPRRDFV